MAPARESVVMSYSQAAFVERDQTSINELIKRHPFATIITCHEAATDISHLPFVFKESEGRLGCLYVHLARANPHCRAIEAANECVVVFRGPDSYISPHWYEENAEDHVPTWNYAVVHVHGKAERVLDEKLLLWQMTQIYISQEDDGKLPITEVDKEQLFPHVALFRIHIERFESIFKLTQNRTPEDALGAIEGLRKTGDSQKIELSDMMQKSLLSRS